jgi:hypothetical protein
MWMYRGCGAELRLRRDAKRRTAYQRRVEIQASAPTPLNAEPTHDAASDKLSDGGTGRRLAEEGMRHSGRCYDAYSIMV